MNCKEMWKNCDGKRLKWQILVLLAKEPTFHFTLAIFSTKSDALEPNFQAPKQIFSVF